MKVTFLGTGTSHGVPVSGCSCPVCTSDDAHNKRTRCSVWIEDRDTSILIDTSTDFRTQSLREGITAIDAVFFTHAHADHLHGLDDIRPYSWDTVIPVYGNGETIADIRRRFYYIFEESQKGGGKPNIELHEMKGAVTVNSIRVIPVPIEHGKLEILGFRIGSFAYLTDCSGIPDSSYSLLKDLDVLVLGALRYREHETHFSVAEALKEAEKIGARQTWFTHICHKLEHKKLDSELPDTVSPAWDGLTLIIENEQKINS